MPVHKIVASKSKALYKVPLTFTSQVQANEFKIYDVRLTLRDPKGLSFGQEISLKMKCVLPAGDRNSGDVKKPKTKFHEQLRRKDADESKKMGQQSMQRRPAID